MPNSIPADGEAMSAKALSRRAALGALASVPALAIPAAAAALAMPATPTLVALIEAHVAAKAAFYVEIDAFQASEPGYHTPFACLDYPDIKVGCRPDDLLETIDRIFDREAEKFAKLEKLRRTSPPPRAHASTKSERHATPAWTNCLQNTGGPRSATGPPAKRSGRPWSRSALTVAVHPRNSPRRLGFDAALRARRTDARAIRRGSPGAASGRGDGRGLSAFGRS